MKEQQLTHGRLLSVLTYEPDSGDFFWKVNRGGLVKSGDKAGCLFRRDNNIRITIDGAGHMAHRLAWFYVHGTWPSAELDHINCNAADNRIANLREASRVENCQNQRAKRGKTGLKGVSWDRERRLYVAYIRPEPGKRKNLGRFKTAEEAHQAYCNAADKYHKDFARHG
ncbi:HNH endonuclease [Cupriavidus taiwanensis]|uniref:HNH endonuclease n=1 Tax=Cupriavidus taiwanensis TaxID=164546 RepID=UPI000E172550|nr:HNH endonuclease [Cupriavidus taiwanensis]SPA44626.1 Pathogenesis-related transcriptional factor and ERF protein [Cupriavidus taiwanensis]